jgi:hypothetical protein
LMDSIAAGRRVFVASVEQHIGAAFYSQFRTS